MATAQDRGWGPGWPNCQTSKLTLIEPVPGKRFTVREELADLFSAFIRRYDAEVEDINVGEDDGCFNCRPVRGTEDDASPIPSNHSWGIALDLNTGQHPLAKRGTFSAARLAALRRLYATPAFRNMGWGGDYYRRADEMHHEYMGTPADAAADTALLEDSDMPLSRDDLAAIGTVVDQRLTAVFTGKGQRTDEDSFERLYQDTLTTKRLVGSLVEKVDNLTAGSTSAIDYDELATALAPKLAADLAARLQA